MGTEYSSASALSKTRAWGGNILCTTSTPLVLAVTCQCPKKYKASKIFYHWSKWVLQERQHFFFKLVCCSPQQLLQIRRLPVIVLACLTSPNCFSWFCSLNLQVWLHSGRSAAKRAQPLNLLSKLLIVFWNSLLNTNLKWLPDDLQLLKLGLKLCLEPMSFYS